MQYPKLQEKDEMNFPSAKEDPGRDRQLSLLAKLYFEIEISHFMCLVRNTKTKMALRFPASKQHQNNNRRAYPMYAAKMLGYHRENKTTPESCLFIRRGNIYFSKKLSLLVFTCHSLLHDKGQTNELALLVQGKNEFLCSVYKNFPYYHLPFKYLCTEETPFLSTHRP